MQDHVASERVTPARDTVRVGFAGTPEFAAQQLAALIQHGWLPRVVYTQPDRPAGRGRHLRASPVKQLAESHDITVLQPKTLRGEGEAAMLATYRLDVLVVAAYGLLLPQSILNLPRFGCLNVHASLLPRWRGAAPIQAAILAGDVRSGVCLMQMDAGLDTGGVFAAESVEIGSEETAEHLHDRIAALGAALLCKTLPDILNQTRVARAQDDACATYAPRIKKQDALIDWQKSALQLSREVRAYNAWPVSHSYIEGQLLRVWSAQPREQKELPAPGTIIAAGEYGIDVATGDGVLRLTEVQSAGRKRIGADEFARQRELPGITLGQ